MFVIVGVVNFNSVGLVSVFYIGDVYIIVFIFIVKIFVGVGLFNIGDGLYVVN